MAETTVETKPKVEEEIRITPRAVDEVRRIKEENKVPESFSLRVGVKGGGCSGFTYVLLFDDQSREGDHAFDISGVKVVVDPKSLFFISGMELDFSHGLNGKGFVFNNPHATRTCGCGSSFGV
jgi:iron-sulfur cluster assembly protein